MAKEISKAKIGIVWHTTYKGTEFENMKASYGVDVSKMNKSSNVWSQDAMLRDMTKYTMSKKDTEEVNANLSKIESDYIYGQTLHVNCVIFTPRLMQKRFLNGPYH